MHLTVQTLAGSGIMLLGCLVCLSVHLSVAELVDTIF